MKAKRKTLPRIDVVWRDREMRWGVIQRRVWREVAETQQRAIAFARELAVILGGATVRVHRRDGRIRAEYTYPRSRDPRRSKG